MMDRLIYNCVVEKEIDEAGVQTGQKFMTIQVGTMSVLFSRKNDRGQRIK